MSAVTFSFLSANEVKTTEPLKQEEKWRMFIVEKMDSMHRELIIHVCMVADLIQLTSRGSDREASTVTPCCHVWTCSYVRLS